MFAQKFYCHHVNSGFKNLQTYFHTIIPSTHLLLLILYTDFQIFLNHHLYQKSRPLLSPKIKVKIDIPGYNQCNPLAKALQAGLLNALIYGFNLCICTQMTLLFSPSKSEISSFFLSNLNLNSSLWISLLFEDFPGYYNLSNQQIAELS